MQRLRRPRQIPQPNTNLPRVPARLPARARNRAASCKATLRSASARACSYRCWSIINARLIAAHRRDHIVGLDECGEPFRLTQRHHRFLVTTELGEKRWRTTSGPERVPTVASGVQRRRSLRDVLAHDCDCRPAGSTGRARMGQTDGCESWASSACLSARPWRAMARDWLPRAYAIRPWSRQTSRAARAVRSSRGESGGRPSVADRLREVVSPSARPRRARSAGPSSSSCLTRGGLQAPA